MKYDIQNRYTGEIQFKANFGCADNVSDPVKIGLAVKWAIENDVDLNEADLSGADLSDADLRYANLSSANLRYADLCKADLSGANLCEANLNRSTDVTQ